MKVNDFLLFTFEGDTASPPDTYVAEISSMDPATEFFSCLQVDTGQQYTFQYSTNTSGPWQGSDDAGTDHVIETHDIYTPGGVDPSPQGIAVVTFADNKRYLCYVESISPSLDLIFYHLPYPRLSLDGLSITVSNWDSYPVDSQIASIEGYILDNDIPAPVTVAAGVFNNGWWSLAQQRPAFAGRIGGNIVPFATVVHTTDMVPESWDGLVDRWTTELGPGDCAHFLIGRDTAHGLIQLAPITSNANHAGGAGHGTFEAGNQSWHPNSVAVGIEVHCAGSVQKINGDWRLVEDGVAQGGALPDADVIQDPQRPNRGWHKVTDYQYQQLGALLDGLEIELAPLPAGCVAKSIEQPPAWGIFPTGRIVGHVSLTASRRGDPWPPTCDWIRARP